MPKKFLGLLLALAMLLILFPATAGAYDYKLYIGGTEVTLPTTVGQYCYGNNDAGAGTISDTIPTDGSATWWVSTDGNGSYTLTLDSATIISNSTDRAAGIETYDDLTIVLKNDNKVTGADVTGENSTYGLGIWNNHNLTICGTGTLTAYGGKAETGSSKGIEAGSVTVRDSVVLNVYGGQATGGVGGSSYGISALRVEIAAGEVNAFGGNGKGESSGIIANVIEIGAGATLNATGGTTSAASSGVRSFNDNLTISGGGTLNATGGEGSESYGIHSYSGSVTISGGTVTATGSTASDKSYGIHAGGSYSITISGGTVTATMNIKPLYTVTVKDGTGSNDYKADSTVHITANAAQSGKVFDKWTTEDGVTFDNDTAAITSFTMPAKPVTVTATYKDASTPTTPTPSGSGSGGGSSPAYHSITATAGDEGGVITPSAKVREGQSQTYTITPAEGYVIVDVLVDGVSVGAVTEYTFKDVKEGHTIEAVFEPAPPAAEPEETTPDTEAGAWTNPFADVPDNAWYCEDVRYVYEHALIRGTAADRFAPQTATNRGMIVTILWRVEGDPAATKATLFNDVAAGKYYADAVQWAAENGVVSGYSAGSFGPDDNITREQLASVLCRFAEYKKCDISARDDLSAFRDRPSDWALESVQWAVAEGLLTGKGDGLLDPRAGATRAECAAILKRFIEKYGLL